MFSQTKFENLIRFLFVTEFHSYSSIFSKQVTIWNNKQMKIEQLEKETEGENIFYWFSSLCFHSENIHSVKNQLDIFKFNFDSFHLCVGECGHLCKKWNFLFEFDEVWSWERFYRCVTAWKRDLAPRSAIKLSIQWPLQSHTRKWSFVRTIF